jgi:hypothetical protein
VVYRRSHPLDFSQTSFAWLSVSQTPLQFTDVPLTPVTDYVPENRRRAGNGL